MDRLTINVTVDSNPAYTELTGQPGVRPVGPDSLALVAARGGVTVGLVTFNKLDRNERHTFINLHRVYVSERLRDSHRQHVYDHLYRVCAKTLADHLGESVTVTAFPSDRRPAPTGWHAKANRLHSTGYPSASKIAAMWGEAI